MARDLDDTSTTETAPMPLYKAIGGLLLVYVVIVGYALWQLRRFCLLERDDCGPTALLETILSNRLTLIGSILVLAVLLQITWHVIRLARAGKLGVEEDPPEPRFNGSGAVVAIGVVVLFVAISLSFLISALNDTGMLLDPRSASLYAWKLNAPMIAAPVVFAALWHVNDYFTRPAPGILLMLLFFLTFGVIYWATKFLFLDAGV